MEPFCSQCFVTAKDLIDYGIAKDGSKLWWFKMVEDSPVEMGLDESDITYQFLARMQKDFDYDKNTDGDLVCVNCMTKFEEGYNDF